MNAECAYCGSDVYDHEPISVEDLGENGVRVGQFCNYACLSAYIDDRELTTGACCRIDL